MKFTSFFLSIIILLQLGCKKNDDMNTDTPQPESPAIADDAVKVTATVTGTVIDENNKPVAGVNVTSGLYTTSTDAMGNFIFKDISISKANGNVTVVKAGYFKGIRSFATDPDKNNYVKIQLMKKVLTSTLTAAAGGTVTTSDGATINFPANAFVTSGGAAFTGTVSIYAKWIDPTAANLPLVIPGDLRGIDSTNREFVLKSYGMVGAEFTDNSGNLLKIAPGKTASVNFPIPASLQATAPQSIPLWHFNESTARWKMEGAATKNGNNYVCAVNKFSFWNVDMAVDLVRLDLTLINGLNNLPMVNTMVKITGLTSNTFGYEFTNNSGYVSGYVPKNENLKLEIIFGPACGNGAIINTQNIGPFTANKSLGNVIVTPAAGYVVNFTGLIKNCNNQPVINGSVSLALSDGNSAMAFTDSAGAINISLLHCGGTQAFSFNAIDFTTGAYSSTVTGIATTSSVNLGTISACGNLGGVYIAGYIANNAVLWKDGVPTFLTNFLPSASAYARAKKVIEYNNDVYVLGNQDSAGYNTIKYWKNGVVTNLFTSQKQTVANDIVVDNNDVYVCGYTYMNNSIRETGYIWKNGIATPLPVDTFDFVWGYSMKIINGDIYVCGTGYKQISGTSNTVGKGVYWKNGIINLVGTTGSFSAHDIYPVNSDIYICGYESIPISASNRVEKPVYFKNNIQTTLPLIGNHVSANVTSIFVDNNDVYTAGYVYYTDFGSNFYQNAAYWKNGTINLLTNYSVNSSPRASLHDIFVKNNIIYAVGESYNNGNNNRYLPLYYQNGSAVQLSGFSPVQDAGAYSIFVK
jgi:hypothetical protein